MALTTLCVEVFTQSARPIFQHVIMALLGSWPESMWPSESIYTLSLKKMPAPSQTDSSLHRGVLPEVSFIEKMSPLPSSPALASIPSLSF